MASPRKHPIKRLRQLAQESAELLWKGYELHMSAELRNEIWEEHAWQLLAKCMDADKRVWRLKEMEARYAGPGDDTTTERGGEKPKARAEKKEGKGTEGDY